MARPPKRQAAASRAPRPPYTDETYDHILDTLDDEERELLDAIEAGEWQSAPDFPTRKRAAEAMAQTTLKTRQKKIARISLRLTPTDLEAIKVKAAQQGIPYQTLITSLIHKYVSGQLVEK